uniref:Fungal lipase-like domain-containing protein n=1 Tax=Leersia perrieri TaxID=77586 RepID=A0A0D9VLU1_9ORYZ
MATATMATAAGAAALLYYTLNRRLQVEKMNQEGDCGDGRDAATRGALSTASRSRVSRRDVRAPATWLETISTLSETLRFTYSETLGKWPIGDLAFGISFLLKRQGNVPVASIYAGDDSVELKGDPVIADLKYLLNLLTLCWHFSKKPFPLFLEATGYSSEDVLMQEPKAGILKPAFTVILDRDKQCILLLIRGTHSIRDTLTAATGAVVPFHHTIVQEGGVSDLVLGYAHFGMVAAARWIAKLAAPCLAQALHTHPDYKIKIVGHSLGGGTAALLTYVLREQQEFASTTCVSFAPAACMTWDLAESGVHFITTVINGADLVPTFSAASVDDLRSEVTASAWLNDLRHQIEQTRILSTFYRSASALGSRLPSIANAKARVAGAGAILRPVSNGTQVVMRRARSVAQAAWTRPALQLSSWTCIGPRRRTNTVSTSTVTTEEIRTSTNGSSESTSLLTEDTVETTQIVQTETMQFAASEEVQSSTEVSDAVEMMDEKVDSDGEDIIDHHVDEERMTDVELWQQLENELYRRREDDEIVEEEDMTESAINEEVGGTAEDVLSETNDKEVHRFYPPGKIMHILTSSREETISSEESSVHQDDDDASGDSGTRIGIFLTPRSLYGKLRLSKMMINDHYMPIYRRNIEQLIAELEKDLSFQVSDNEAS